MSWQRETNILTMEGPVKGTGMSTCVTLMEDVFQKQEQTLWWL